jgi:hypothetical protein
MTNLLDRLTKSDIRICRNPHTASGFGTIVFVLALLD